MKKATVLKTDWWTGRQEASAEGILRSGRVKATLKQLKGFRVYNSPPAESAPEPPKVQKS